MKRLGDSKVINNIMKSGKYLDIWEIMFLRYINFVYCISFYGVCRNMCIYEK